MSWGLKKKQKTVCPFKTNEIVNMALTANTKTKKNQKYLYLKMSVSVSRCFWSTYLIN